MQTGVPMDRARVGFLAFNAELDTFATALIDAVLRAGEARGMQVTLVDGGGDSDTQLAAVRGFVADGADAILLYPGDPSTLVPAVREAAERGIPVFTVNLDLEDSAPVAAYIGSDDMDYGRKQGHLLVRAIGETGNVALLTGESGTSAQIARTAGLNEVLGGHPGIRVVAEHEDDWTDATALAIVQGWLAEFPAGSLGAILAEGPEVAPAARWAREHGRDDIVFVAGDYTSDVREAILEGAVYGTVVQHPSEQGERAVEVVADVLAGSAAGSSAGGAGRVRVLTDLPVVTRDNAAGVPAAYA